MAWTPQMLTPVRPAPTQPPEKTGASLPPFLRGGEGSPGALLCLPPPWCQRVATRCPSPCQQHQQGAAPTGACPAGSPAICTPSSALPLGDPRGKRGLGRAGCRATTLLPVEMVMCRPPGAPEPRLGPGYLSQGTGPGLLGGIPGLFHLSWCRLPLAPFCSQGAKTAGRHRPPHASLSSADPSPRIPTWSERCRGGGSCDSELPSPNSILWSYWPARVSGGQKGAFFMGDRLFPYKETEARSGLGTNLRFYH